MSAPDHLAALAARQFIRLKEITMDAAIKPIETRYDGHHFRSRLEARVAVALNHDGIRWEYEPEGFETPAGRYLPDFLIETRIQELILNDNDTVTAGQVSSLPLWIEVKHLDYAVSPSEQARYWHVVHGTQKALMILFGLDGGQILLRPNETLTMSSPADRRPPWMSQSALVAAQSARF